MREKGIEVAPFRAVLTKTCQMQHYVRFMYCIRFAPAFVLLCLVDCGDYCQLKSTLFLSCLCVEEARKSLCVCVLLEGRSRGRRGQIFHYLLYVLLEVLFYLYMKLHHFQLTHGAIKCVIMSVENKSAQIVFFFFASCAHTGEKERSYVKNVHHSSHCLMTLRQHKTGEF